MLEMADSNGASSVPPVVTIPHVKDPKLVWENEVRKRYRDRCGNCGNDDRLVTKLLVPLEVGGKLEVSNGYVLCRACEISSKSAGGASEPTEKRPINFWVSRDLWEYLQKKTQDGSSFSSMGALVRYLMTFYIENEAQFDDLELYQDTEEDKVKLNVWVEPNCYEVFREKIYHRGLTVTSALRHLLRFFEMNVDRLLQEG